MSTNVKDVPIAVWVVAAIGAVAPLAVGGGPIDALINGAIWLLIAYGVWRLVVRLRR